MKLKDRLFQHCLHLAEERVKRVQIEIKQVQLSANAETKSSAGDKYETGRTMAQLEIERNTRQLMETEKLRSKIQELAGVKVSDTIISGALVHTSQGLFYISVSLGLVDVEGEQYYCISADAPVAKALMGKCAGEVVSFQGKTFSILRVE